MKTKPTKENKYQYFAQYFGQKVLAEEGGIDSDYLELTPLQNITDEDAVEVANLAFKRGKLEWVISKRDETGVWMRAVDDLDIEHYFRLNEYGAISSKITFPPEGKEEEIKRFTHNIGAVGNNIMDGIPYIHVVDFLRGKGYALQFKDVGVKKLVEWGWLVLKENKVKEPKVENKLFKSKWSLYSGNGRRRSYATKGR